MADINTGPQPIAVSGNTAGIPLSQIDRTPVAVPTGTPQTPVPPAAIPAGAVDRSAGAASSPYQGGVTPSRATVTVAATTVTPPVAGGSVIPAPAGALPIAVADEGTTLTTAVRSFNFVGDGVVAVANTQNNAVTVTITGGNVISNYSNANVAAYLPTNTSNVSGNYFIGNGSLLTGIVAVSSYANANVAAYLPTYTGNLVALTGNVTTTANISGSYILGNGSQLTGLAASYGNANVVANLAALGTNPVSTTGNITGNFFVGNGSQLTGLAATYGNANVVANLAALGSNPISTTGNITGNYFIGNGRQLTSVSTSFENEIHVAQNGNDTSGDGTINYPYLTIQKGVDISANPLTDRRTVVIHPGTYIENVTVTFNNTQIITYDLTGASTTVSGTLTLANNAQRLAGLKITNLIIAGNTQAYINSCTVTGQLTKSSSGYVEMVDVDMSVSGNVQITGGGTTLIDSNKIVNLRVANASASVSLRNVNQVYSPEVTAGTLSMFNCFVQASGNTANAITASVGTVLQLFNTTIYNLGLTAPARISVGGFYQLSDTQYDRANSVLGTSLGAISFFQSANIDSVTVNTTVVATGNVTGGNVLTGGLISATGNITGGNVSTGMITLTNGAVIKDTAGDAVSFGELAGNTSQGNSATAVGYGAGKTTQGQAAVAVGVLAGNSIQGDSAVAIGQSAGSTSQGNAAVAVGAVAGDANQGIQAVAIGLYAGYNTQGAYSVALGASSGQTSQGQESVAVGVQAGVTGQGNIAVAVGSSAGYTGQGAAAVAVGQSAGAYTQGIQTVAVGYLAGNATQANYSVAVGARAGIATQGEQAVAIGYAAGLTAQGNYAVAVGKFAANSNQGIYAVAVGPNAGQDNQLANAVAIGFQAGASSQGTDSVAVGGSAALNGQGSNAVAVGNSAAYLVQGANSVAVGVNAGLFYLGISSIAIGANAGNNQQGNNSIIFNATGSNLRNTTANTFTVAPVRNDVANTANVMFYNATSKEITYGNVISVAGNITGGYILGNGSQLTGVNAVTVDITDTNGLTTVYYPTFVENRTTAQIARADVNLTYRTDDNLLTVGNVSVTGNISGGNLTVGSGTITGGNVNGANFNGNVAFGAGTVGGSGNITGGNLSITGNITGTASFSGSISINNAPGGIEGAEMQWALPSVANTSLSGSLIQDVYTNGMRFFESSGNTRGLYMDLGNAPNGSGTAVGYREVPQILFTGNTTIASTDAGRHFYSVSASNLQLTIANNTSVAWTVGTAMTIVNRGTANVLIVPGTGVSLYLAGNSTSANRVVTTYGMATMINVAANIWMINGTVV